MTRKSGQPQRKARRQKDIWRAVSTVKRSGTKSSRDKVKAHRERMRRRGMKLVQIWVLTLDPHFAAEARRQSRMLADSPTEPIAPFARLLIRPSPNGLQTPSRLMVDKIHVSKSKLGFRVGRLDDADLPRLDWHLKIFLGLSG